MKKYSAHEANEILGKMALLLDEAMENIERNDYLSQCSDDLRNWTERRRRSLINLLQEGLDGRVSKRSVEEIFEAARQKILAAQNKGCSECTDQE